MRGLTHGLVATSALVLSACGSPNALAPVPVTGLTNVIAIVAGNDHSCAALADGSYACWGNNQSGQLGDGTTTSSLVPVVFTL